MKVVDSLTPFVEEERWWFSITWFDPIREQMAFVSLVPQVLIKISICDFLKRINFITWNQMTVEIHKFNIHFFEDSLCKEMPFDSGKSLIRVIISLFNQSKFLFLSLIKS